MAETADTVIKDALQELLVQASEAPIEASEAQTAIRFMNRLMSRWSASGIDLGYTLVSSLGDAVTVPEGAYDGVVKNLAISLGPQYDVPISIDLRISAKEALNDIRAITFSIGATEYGDTTPIGSGNEGETTFDGGHFYPDLQDDILTETTGSIGLESETAENT